MALTKTPIELSSTPSIVDGGNATAITIDSSERVGLGLTPNAGWTVDPILQVGPFAMASRATSASSLTDLGQLSTNQYWDGSNHKYIATGNSSMYTQNDGTHIFAGAPSGSAGGNITYVTGLTISAAGAATVGNGLTLTDGNVVVANGHGIDFSADGHASGMSSELLDDYEEGAWTPAFQNIGNGTYVVQVGKYTKIGNLVAASFHIDINAIGSASGHLIITGLPFAADNITANYGSFTTTHASGWSAALTNLGGLVSPGTSTAPVFYQASTAMTAVTHAQMQTGNFLATLIYQSS